MSQDTEKILRKTRKCKYFESFIPKILKQTYDSNSLNSNVKTQINNSIKIFIRVVTNSSVKLLQYQNRKVLSSKEIMYGLKKFVDDDTYKLCINVGTQALTNYNIYTEKKSVVRKPRKNKRAMLTIPPVIVEKIMRNCIPKSILLGAQTPIFLTACIEYIVGEILDSAVQVTIDSNKQRITIDHLEKGVSCNHSLLYIFKQLQISFLGGKGTIDIHRDILIGKNSKKEKCILKNIKNRQKDCKLIVPKSVFERFVRKIIKRKCGERKVSKIVFIFLQHYIENYIINILKKANILTLYSNRHKVTPMDIGMVSFFGNTRGDFKLDEYYLYIKEFNNAKQGYTDNTDTDNLLDENDDLEFKEIYKAGIDIKSEIEPTEIDQTEIEHTEQTEIEQIDSNSDDGTVIEVGNTEIEVGNSDHSENDDIEE